MEGDANPFQRRSAADLLKVIPECESAELVSNINEVFDLLEDKVTSMTNVIASMIGRDKCSDSFLKKIIADCDGMCSLIEMQQLKCFIIKSKTISSFKMTPEDARREQKLMHKLFPGNKRSFPQPPIFAEGEKKKRKTQDFLIVGVNRSVFKQFLLFPSPVFKMSEFVYNTSAFPGKFRENQIGSVITALKRDNFIKLLPLDTGKDYLILKEISSTMVLESLKKFGLTKEEYLAATIPSSIKTLKNMVESIDQSIIRVLESELWTSMGEIVSATIMMDSSPSIPYADLPNNVPKAVLKATNSLVQRHVLSLNDSPELTFTKTGI